MIRSKGEAGNRQRGRGHPAHALDLQALSAPWGTLPDEELFRGREGPAGPYEIVAEVARLGKLPVVLFTAGGIATPADAAMMMQLGAEGVFVGSGIFKVGGSGARAAAIVKPPPSTTIPTSWPRSPAGSVSPWSDQHRYPAAADRYASRGW